MVFPTIGKTGCALDLRPELEWLEKLKFSAEHESMSVLFAKPISELPNCTKVVIRENSSKSPQRQSIYLNKRQSRCIARLTPSTTASSIPEDNYKSMVSIASLADEEQKGDEQEEHDQSRFALSLPNGDVVKTQMRHPLNRRGKKQMIYRHSIRVNDDSEVITTLRPVNMSKSFKRYTSSSSSNLSSTSADSGQCSANSNIPDVMIGSNISDFSRELAMSLPSYIKIANTMDHILRVASTVLTLLDSNTEDVKLTRELIQKTKLYIEITKQSACGPFLNQDDLYPVTDFIDQLERRCNNTINNLPDYFNIYVRKMIEQSMVVYARVTCIYLNECVNKDRLLIIALEHLIHLLLFGDEILLEAIRLKSIERLLEFCQMTSTPTETLRLLLRALAVLCGVNKGCVQLLSIGGLNIVIELLCSSPLQCAVEAAGVLTQLTSPNHPFTKPGKLIFATVPRLLQLLDDSTSVEAVLLCTAALANLSSQDEVTELLYQKNAVLRLVKACGRSNCANAFVFEQVVTIFSRLAICGYDQVLIAQKAIPLLLDMIALPTTEKVDYHHRVRYKAAVCLSTIAATGIGLKAVHVNHGHSKLNEILKREEKFSTKSAPFSLLCGSINHRLEQIYLAK